MTDWQRLEQLIKWTGLSTNAFAMVVGLRRSENLYQIKRGNHGISKVLAAQIAAKYPGVNRAWLLMEQGEMFLPGFIPGVGAGVAAPQGPQIKPEVEPRSGIDVPFFDRDVVRLISEMGGVWDRAGKPTDHIRVPGLGDCDFAAIHTGSTLAPEVPSGAIVALKAVALDAPLLPGEIYLVVTSDLAALRYVSVSPTRPALLHLVSGAGAAEQPPIKVDRRRLRHLYLVKGIIVQKVL